ncbi:MAG: addiction module protein [Verrucomicrobiales bacterium]|jgi:putative addiction module component (TIGR02574 family)|nr:addiction module protein [Verrucomicrobiales bacterium]
MVSLPELLELPKKQRLAIAEQLWSSVEDEVNFTAPASHRKIVRDRLAAYRSGEVETLSREEFMRRYLAHRAEPKRLAK